MKHENSTEKDKISNKILTFFNNKVKYRKLYDKFEKSGYLRPIYKCDDFVITFLSNCAYYIIYYNTGLAINIRPDAFLQVIENPKKTLKAFRKLPDSKKIRVAFYIWSDKMEEVFIDVIRKVEEKPERSGYSPDDEKVVFDKYGYPESLFPENN